MDDERTNKLRQHFSDEDLLGWVDKFGNEPIYPATAIKQIKRELIVAMKYAGFSHQEVVDELDVCLSHVYNTWNDWREGRPL